MTALPPTCRRRNGTILLNQYDSAVKVSIQGKLYTQSLLGGAVVVSVDQPVPDVGVGEAVQDQRLLVSHHLNVSFICPDTSL